MRSPLEPKVIGLRVPPNYSPLLERAFNDDTVVVVDVPVDYRENMKLTEKLGQLVCPI